MGGGYPGLSESGRRAHPGLSGGRGELPDRQSGGTRLRLTSAVAPKLPPPPKALWRDKLAGQVGAARGGGLIVRIGPDCCGLWRIGFGIQKSVIRKRGGVRSPLLEPSTRQEPHF